MGQAAEPSIQQHEQLEPRSTDDVSKAGSPKLSQESGEVASVPRSELAKPENPVENPQPLTDEQIDKIVELAERIRKSKAKQNGEIDLEKILSMSPNPLAAVKALERLELRKEMLKIIEEIDYPNLSTKEKIFFCEQIGWKEEAERLKERLWQEELDEAILTVSMVVECKRRGGYINPQLEQWLRYDIQDMFQRRKEGLGLG